MPRFTFLVSATCVVRHIFSAVLHTVFCSECSGVVAELHDSLGIYIYLFIYLYKCVCIYKNTTEMKIFGIFAMCIVI